MPIIGIPQTNETTDNNALREFHFQNADTNDILTLQDLLLSSIQCIPVLRSDFLQEQHSLIFTHLYCKTNTAETNFCASTELFMKVFLV